MPFRGNTLSLWPATKSRPPSLQPTWPLEKLENDGFGLPVDDPDPFGVLALEKAGLEIREAGSLSRPASEEFEYRPSPTSPIFSTFGRLSMQSLDRRSMRDLRRDSRRDSRKSALSIDQGTQTAEVNAPPLSPTLAEPPSAHLCRKRDNNLDTEAWIINEESDDYMGAEPSSDASGNPSSLSKNEAKVAFTQEPAGIEEEPRVMIEPELESIIEIHPTSAQDLETEKASESCMNDMENALINVELEDEQEFLSDEEPEAIISAASPAVQINTHATASLLVSRAKIVTIAKRTPPALPPRSPFRARVPPDDSEMANIDMDRSHDSDSQYSVSPTRSSFDKNSIDSPNPWSEQTSIPDLGSRGSSEIGSLRKTTNEVAHPSCGIQSSRGIVLDTRDDSDDDILDSYAISDEPTSGQEDTLGLTISNDKYHHSEDQTNADDHEDNDSTPTKSTLATRTFDSYDGHTINTPTRLDLDLDTADLEHEEEFHSMSSTPYENSIMQPGVEGAFAGDAPLTTASAIICTSADVTFS